MERRKRIVITGTGRAGTTLLVQLLTELRLDTGYEPGKWGDDYNDFSSAGLERDVWDPNSPYIVKNPDLGPALAETLVRSAIVIDHVFIPVRRLEDAAASRVRIGGDGTVPGGLTGRIDPGEQKAILAERFHHLVEALVSHEIPHTFLHFPRFARDPAYAFERLKPILAGVDRARFEECFRKVARPSLIHSFGDDSKSSNGIPARRYMKLTRWRRVRRRVARTAAAAAFLFASWIIARDFWNAGHQVALAPPSRTARAVEIHDEPPGKAPVGPSGPASVLRRVNGRYRAYGAPRN